MSFRWPIKPNIHFPTFRMEETLLDVQEQGAVLDRPAKLPSFLFVSRVLFKRVLGVAELQKQRTVETMQCFGCHGREKLDVTDPSGRIKLVVDINTGGVGWNRNPRSLLIHGR